MAGSVINCGAYRTYRELPLSEGRKMGERHASSRHWAFPGRPTATHAVHGTKLHSPRHVTSTTVRGLPALLSRPSGHIGVFLRESTLQTTDTGSAIARTAYVDDDWCAQRSSCWPSQGLSLCCRLFSPRYRALKRPPAELNPASYSCNGKRKRSRRSSLIKAMFINLAQKGRRWAPSPCDIWWLDVKCLASVEIPTGTLANPLFFFWCLAMPRSYRIALA